MAEKKHIIVAVVGMCGSGKSEATEVFLQNGFNRVYFGDVTFNEMKKRNIPVNWENERMMREKIREEAKGDKGIYALLMLPDIKAAYKKGNVLIESLYSWSEYKYIKKEYGDNFFVLAIVTDKGLREARLINRPVRPMTKKDVDERDYAEIENIEKGGPIAIADFYISNNGEMGELADKVRALINNLQKK